MKMRNLLSAFLGFIALATAEETASADTNIKVWPRHEYVSMPTNLEQFIFIEVPKLPVDGNFSMTITLPEGIETVGFLSGVSPAVPPPNISMIPETWSQNGNTLTMNFADGIFPEQPKAWLSMCAKVNTPVGDGYKMKISLSANGNEIQSNDFDVKIYPELINKTSKIMPIIGWYYTGLDPKYVPAFMNQFTAAGVNGFYSMTGERINGEIAQNTVCDLAPQYGTEQGMVFFSGWLRDFAEKNKLFDTQNGQYSLQWMIDNPASFKTAFKAYIDYNNGGKKNHVIIYDAEAGSIGETEIEGDLSKYSLEKFSKKVGSEKTLTPEEIFEGYQEDWMWFNCRQSLEIAKLAREAIDEYYPGTLFMVYSGYEYDFAPHKNLTRKNYSVDWRSMGEECALDYAGAGYYGSAEDLNNTFRVLEGATTYIPADMYLENFVSPYSAPTPEQWTMRLIRVFMDSGMRGISLWYANDIDGAGLISISEFTKFLLMIEDFAIRGQLEPAAVSVMPRSEVSNVYVIRDTKRALVVLLNNTEKAKNITLTLNDFKINGYTSDIQITDIVSGEKFPAKREQRIKVDPMSYRIINILDDGN